MIASLPMYDWPETIAYNDMFWNNMRASLLSVCDNIPEQLNRSDVNVQWQRDDVLVSQTCIYPLVTKLPSSTAVIGTPLYAVEHCEDGYYASVLLVRNSDKRNELPAFVDSTLAFNGRDSQSGFNALKSLLVDEQLISDEKPVFFADNIRAGSHRQSIAAVAQGSADVCAIDPVSWALARRYDDHAKQVRVLMPTAFAPALPLISSAGAVPASMNEEQWRLAVMGAFEQAIDDTAREHLLFSGITHIPKHDYLQLPISSLDMITD